jgi:Superinfection immunity protein
MPLKRLSNRPLTNPPPPDPEPPPTPSAFSNRDLKAEVSVSLTSATPATRPLVCAPNFTLTLLSAINIRVNQREDMRARTFWFGIAAICLTLIIVTWLFGPGAADKAISVIGGAVLLGLLGVLYFIPALLSRQHSHRNVHTIFAVNLLLGWTLVGWVAALVWALAKPPEVTIATARGGAPATPSRTVPRRSCRRRSGQRRGLSRPGNTHVVAEVFSAQTAVAEGQGQAPCAFGFF